LFLLFVKKFISLSIISFKITAATEKKNEKEKEKEKILSLI
jgi:hypothetical protein